jgi:hypothetical protein
LKIPLKIYNIWGTLTKCLKNYKAFRAFFENALKAIALKAI